jgi:hypothetical protein
MELQWQPAVLTLRSLLLPLNFNDNLLYLPWGPCYYHWTSMTTCCTYTEVPATTIELQWQPAVLTLRSLLLPLSPLLCWKPDRMSYSNESTRLHSDSEPGCPATADNDRLTKGYLESETLGCQSFITICDLSVWDVADRYQHFRRTWCFHLQDRENTGTYLTTKWCQIPECKLKFITVFTTGH